LAVDPNHARKGIGSRLLEAVEQVLAASGVGRIRVAESAPNYLTPGVDLRYRAALRFFDHHGYRPLAEACNMRVSLADRAFETAEAQRRLQDAGIEVRRATTRDRAELIRLAREFGGRWDAEVTRSLAHEPPLVHIARRGQDLLGFAASEGNNSGTGWFGPMGTTEAARGLGIGRVLLYRCLSDLAAMGFSEAIIPWVGPVAFYARHVGATIDRRFQRLEKILTP
jgi:GNAT superfamily N-acetyltransferase